MIRAQRQAVFARRRARAAVAGAMAIAFVGVSAAVAASGKKITLPENHPLHGTWKVYHSSAVAVCRGMRMPIDAQGPDQVRIEVIGEGDKIHVSDSDGSLDMQRVTPTAWESEIRDGVKVLRQVDAGEWALLAEMLGDDGLLYTGQFSLQGQSLHYVLGWLKSSPDEIHGHLTGSQTCEVVRSFRAER